MIKIKGYLIRNLNEVEIQTLKLENFMPISKTWNFEYLVEGPKIIDFLKNNLFDEELYAIKDDYLYNKNFNNINSLDVQNTIFLNFVKNNKREYFPSIYFADFNHTEYMLYWVATMNKEKIDKLFNLVNIFYLFENHRFLSNADNNGCIKCNPNIDESLKLPKTLVDNVLGGSELNLDYKKELLDKIIFKAISKRNNEYIN